MLLLTVRGARFPDNRCCRMENEGVADYCDNCGFVAAARCQSCGRFVCNAHYVRSQGRTQCTDCVAAQSARDVDSVVTRIRELVGEQRERACLQYALQGGSTLDAQKRWRSLTENGLTSHSDALAMVRSVWQHHRLPPQVIYRQSGKRFSAGNLQTIDNVGAIIVEFSDDERGRCVAFIENGALAALTKYPRVSSGVTLGRLDKRQQGRPLDAVIIAGENTDPHREGFVTSPDAYENAFVPARTTGVDRLYGLSDEGVWNLATRLHDALPPATG
jgi:hypothetical protein